MSRQDQDAWQEAKRRCRLSDEEIGMAKELGFQPKSLIKNIPSPSQKWKAPVNIWVRSLYEKKIGSKRKAAAPSAPATPSSPRVIEFRNPDFPWPDRPDIPEIPSPDTAEFGSYEGYDTFEPPDDPEIDEEIALMLRRQHLFRMAAQAIAVSFSKVPEVEKLAAFGAVASPLEMEVPRFRQFRRHGIEIPHECADLDLALWLSDLSKLKETKRALHQGLAAVQDTPYGGVAHHQVDVHLFEAGGDHYRGRLCIFGECPKPKKHQCLVPGCGAEPFLQQFEDYWFNPAQFEAASKVILFDRASGFLVHPPRVDELPPYDPIPY